MATEPIDVEVDHGSLVLFRPVSDDCHDWIDDNVADDASWFGRALVVERRFAGDLVQGMVDGGLVIA